jgi:hypothetical protein
MSEIVKYEAEGVENFSVLLENETVWLTQAQMVALFERDKSVISRHISNSFAEGELDQNSVVANFATTAADGKTYQVEYYSLDVIISVGYRVKSQRGTQFRQWATKVLREHLLKGYTIKHPVGVEQLNELHLQIGEILQRQNKADLRLHSVDAEFGRVYEIIYKITEEKRLQDEKPRKKIGF